MVVERALIDMVQWQKTEHTAIAVHGVHLLVGQEVGAEVTVAQHDAFGKSGSATGVNHSHPVVRLDLAFTALNFGHPFVAVGNTQFEDFQRTMLALDVGQCIDFGLRLQLLKGRTQAS